MENKYLPASLLAIAALASVPSAGAVERDYPHCAVAQFDWDGTVNVHPECLEPSPNETTTTSKASSRWCEVIVIEPDGSHSFHKECIPRILPNA